MSAKVFSVIRWLGLSVVLVAIALLSYKVGHAATAELTLAAGLPTDDASLLDLLRPVYEALTAGQYALTTALALIALTALAKRYLGGALPWLHTDAGGSLLVLVGAGATAAAAGLLAPGTHVTLGLLKNALFAGVTAAGGYAMIKNLIITPVLPLLPSWLRTVLTPLLWIFDGSMKPQEVAIAASVAAGVVAVETKPAQGVQGIVSNVREIK